MKMALGDSKPSDVNTKSEYDLEKQRQESLINWKTVEYRRRLLDIMEYDTELKQKFSVPYSTFKEIETISKTDSNVTGVVFKVQTSSYVPEKWKKYIQFIPNYVAVKIVPYSVDKKSQCGKFTGSTKRLDRRDPTSIEARCLHMFRYLVLSNICPNVTLLYKYFLCDDIYSFARGGKDTSIFKKLTDQTIKKLIKPQCMVLISEYANLGSLRSWRMATKSTTEQWKSILFQTIYTLTVVQDMLEFRHNDLHQANILLDSCEDNTKCIKYSILGINFYVKHAGMLVRLWDFDWCYSKEYLENNKVTLGKSSVDSKTTRHFDLHRLLNHVYCSEKGEIPKEIRKFIRNIYPDEYLGRDSAQLKSYRLKKDADFSRISTPLSLLKHPFFYEYLEKRDHVTPSYNYELGTTFSEVIQRANKNS